MDNILHFINLTEIMFLYLFLFLSTKRKPYKIFTSLYFRSFIYLMFNFSIIDILNQYFKVDIGYFLLLQLLLFIFLAYRRINFILKMKSDKISKSNVCIIAYKPQNCMQMFKSNFGGINSSLGLLIGGKLYQLRYGFDTVQELSYTKDYIYKNYFVINTKYNIKNISQDTIDLLKKQTARQTGFFKLRLNCSRCMRPILNKLPKQWNYKKNSFDFLSSCYIYKRLKWI